MKAKVPSEEEIFQFGKYINIPRIDEFYTAYKLDKKFNKWWHLLHNIGHYAVKSNSYINLWIRNTHSSSKGIPDLDWLYKKFYEQLLCKYTCKHDEIWEECSAEESNLLKLMYWDFSLSQSKIKDPTPDELGVRAWCQLVLNHHNWINPCKLQEWRKNGYRRTDKQWHVDGTHKSNDLSKRNNTFYECGFEQIKAVGIDFDNGNFRPTKELIKVSTDPFRKEFFEIPVSNEIYLQFVLESGSLISAKMVNGMNPFHQTSVQNVM